MPQCFKKSKDNYEHKQRLLNDDDDYDVEVDGNGNDGFWNKNAFLVSKAMTSTFKSHDFYYQNP